MNYEIRHYDTPLLRFSATEDTARPEIEILWVNDDARQLIPLDLTVPAGRAACDTRRHGCGTGILSEARRGVCGCA